MTSRRSGLLHVALLAGSLGFGFAVIEMGYRLIDPYPYVPQWRTNKTEYGNLTQYDPSLGWRGVPNGDATFATPNSVTRLRHNALGYRDVDPAARAPGRPAIVFLGDSYTWGYEVEKDEMFVEHVRRAIPEREIVNISHRGWGTDQELLAFREWQPDRPVETVALMMSGNDIDDNNGTLRSHKPKPRFDVRAGELVLTNVPVPRVAEWDAAIPQASSLPPTRAEWWRALLFRSHFLHDADFRLRQLTGDASGHAPVAAGDCSRLDLRRTRRLLEQLALEVGERGARLVVFAIPSVAEIATSREPHPYQACIAALCERAALEFHDLAPGFRATTLRTYFRSGEHWTPRGHRLAAEAALAALRPTP